MNELLMATDDVFDARIAEMLTRDDYLINDTKPDMAHWKKLRLRLEINASGLKDHTRNDN